MGSADPPGKINEKLNSKNMQKEQFFEWGWGEGDKIIFASGDKGASTPLTKILQTLV